MGDSENMTNDVYKVIGDILNEAESGKLTFEEATKQIKSEINRIIFEK